LVIHANAPLAGAVALQQLEPVCRRRSQVPDAPGQVELLQLAQRRPFDIRKSGDPTESEQGFSVGAPERLDRHKCIVTHGVINVKHAYGSAALAIMSLSLPHRATPELRAARICAI
jgi:hypothetical protein